MHMCHPQALFTGDNLSDTETNFQMQAPLQQAFASGDADGEEEVSTVAVDSRRTVPFTIKTGRWCARENRHYA